MKAKPVAVALGNGRVRIFRGPAAAADADAFRRQSRRPAGRVAKPTLTQRQTKRVLEAVSTVARDVARREEAEQALLDQPEVDALLASRPDLTEPFRDALRGKTLARVEAVLAHLPAPSAQRVAIGLATGTMKYERGVELQGTKLVFGAKRVVRSEVIQ